MNTGNLTDANIEAIVRRVVAQQLSLRTRRSPAEVNVATAITGDALANDRHVAAWDLSRESVVSVRDLQSAPQGVKRLIVSERAVITPAARDWIASNGVVVVNERDATQATGNSSRGTTSAATRIADANCDKRGRAFAKQLQLRIGTPVEFAGPSEADIVLADVPQLSVAQCWRGRREAFQVGSMDEANRVLAQISAQVWVLDMQRLNLIAAVNVARFILNRT